MPESGELEVLPPPSVTSDLVSGRRRVALQLDFDFTCGKTDDFHHLPKRCRLDSMNYSISGSALKQQNTNTESLKARTIQPQELDTKLRKSKSMLLVDCRPFVSYNIAHINGALNVNCSDRFNRKRLQQGKATIVDLVTSRDGKDMFKRRGSKDIILYDDHTKDIHQLSPETSMHIVLASLLREGREAYILKGIYYSSNIYMHEILVYIYILFSKLSYVYYYLRCFLVNKYTSLGELMLLLHWSLAMYLSEV